MSKACLYKQSPSASSLPLPRMPLPRAIPQPQSRGESCHPAQTYCPNSACWCVHQPSQSREGSNARCVLDPGAGTWSLLLPAVQGVPVSQVGSSCPALCPGEPGLVACQAHHFLVCTMETPLCSLGRAEGTFDFKSCRNMCLSSGHCSLALRSQHCLPRFPVDYLP